MDDAVAELLAASKAMLLWYELRLSPFEEGRLSKRLRAAIEKFEDVSQPAFCACPGCGTRDGSHKANCMIESVRIVLDE